MAKISILGSGIVGTIVGRGFKEFGNRVIFYDIDEKKVQDLRNSGLDATTELSNATRESSLMTQKQSPAQRMNYQYYRAMARWARRQEERLKRIEEKLESE